MQSEYITKSYERLLLLSTGLSLYKGISRLEVYKSFQRLLESFSAAEQNPLRIFECYHDFCSLAIESNWPDLLLDILLDEENLFTKNVSKYGFENIAPNLLFAASRDFQIIQELSKISAEKIKATAKEIFNRYFINNNLIESNVEAIYANTFNSTYNELIQPENWPEWNTVTCEKLNLRSESIEFMQKGAQCWLQTERSLIINILRDSKYWSEAINQVAKYYIKVGTGIYSKYVAFRWHLGANNGILKGIPNPDPFCLEELIGLKQELEVILENTEHFLQGYPSNNIILYGDRGTGKSSVIKGLLNKYAMNGLRLIELAKSEIKDIPQIMQLLKESSNKFIVFIDDLSFEENEVEYKNLKTFLEGTLEVRPQNVIFYATSNRRHLIRENISEREGLEVHVRDSKEEKLSLADRFGITVTFTSPNQKEFLAIVDGLVRQRGLCYDQSMIHELALRWQMWHNGFSGRTAKQFIDYLTARSSIESINISG